MIPIHFADKDLDCRLEKHMDEKRPADMTQAAGLNPSDPAYGIATGEPKVEATRSFLRCLAQPARLFAEALQCAKQNRVRHVANPVNAPAAEYSTGSRR